MAQELIRPHIESYNFMLDKGLALAVKDIPPVEVIFAILAHFQVTNGDSGATLRFWIQDIRIGYPIKEDDSVDTRLLPHECRERGISYIFYLLFTLAIQLLLL